MKISIQVKSGKKDPKITETDTGLIIELKSKPIKNAANTELIQILSTHFKVPKTRIKILRGATSNHKIIDIS